MKIRKDFVTNSSSSSFVIAYKDLDIVLGSDEGLSFRAKRLLDACVHCFQEVMSEDSEEINSTESLNNFFLYSYSYTEDESIDDLIERNDWLREKYELASNYIDRGFKIAMINVENHETMKIAIINALCDDEFFILIEGEE